MVDDEEMVEVLSQQIRDEEVELAQYTAGFFEARGAVFLDESSALVVTIRSRERQQMLELINDKVCGGAGRIGNHRLVLRGEAAAQLLKKIEPYAVLKVNEISLGVRAQELNTNKPAGYQDELTLIDAWLKELRHQ